MKTTARDKWLLSILPAIFTAIVYMFGQGTVVTHALNAARIENERARQTAVSPQAITLKRQQAAEWQMKLNAQRDIAAALKASAKLAEVSDSRDRAKTLKAVSDLLTKHNLTLLKSARSVPNASATTLGKNDPLNKLAQSLGRPEPETWRVEITGTYRNMAAAVDALGNFDCFVVPLSIEMKQLDVDAGTQHWTLTIWI